MDSDRLLTQAPHWCAKAIREAMQTTWHSGLYLPPGDEDGARAASIIHMMFDLERSGGNILPELEAYLLLLLTGLCFGGTLPHFTGQSLLLLGYMVLLSAVAQTIWSALTRYNPVGRVAVYGFLNPVFGVLLSALLLREGQQAFTPYSLAALVLVCVGIFVVNRSDTPGRGAQADQQP